jgi:CRP/FNR family cyclic AMP-dependent transcriptional regulator
MDTQFIEAIGYCGTLATVATYSMRSIIPLRIAGIASSLFFIAYASTMGIWPMLLTELIILPINSLRLFQVVREEARRSGRSGRAGELTNLARRAPEVAPASMCPSHAS